VTLSLTPPSVSKKTPQEKTFQVKWSLKLVGPWDHLYRQTHPLGYS
jgi:hypothetical protein